MIPQLTPQQLAAFPSRAEARVYEACRDQLPGDIVVVYSANWIYRDARGKLTEGEADFTLLSPGAGVIIVEVKGGGVRFDPATGAWRSVDRHDQPHPIKDPFRQASGERHALLDQISGHTDWRQWAGGRFTIGHAVFFPDIGDAAPLLGPDRQRELVGINSDLRELTRWFDGVMRFWRQPVDTPLGAKGVRLIEDILCRPIEVRPILRAAVDDAEKQRIRLTANQAKTLRVLGGRQRAVISGGAGTGKTILAAEKARQLAQGGMTVLLLCYNRPLAHWLAAGLVDHPSITALSYHQLCDLRIRQAVALGRDLMSEAAEGYPGAGDKHRFDVLMPFALALAADVVAERFDAIVIDEAQDFSDEYWLGVELQLRDQEAGHFYVFTDENQALYPRRGALPVEGEPFQLTVNCRNTSTIHVAGYRFYKGALVDEPELHGPAVIWTSARTPEAQADAVARRVHQWVQIEGIDSDDVTVLIAARPKALRYELLLARSELAGVKWAVEDHAARRAVLVDTVGRFKGLESQAVVLCLGEEVVDEALWETVYVGLTRAKSLLAVVGSERALDLIRRHNF
ncbi:NERD domain-containing protein/DEAD/DEAH box helicase [Variovorax sp. 38R]|uniref:NERD domain-containing protein n=1 Tax=Variovorax sp. 38R TaxID=2774875 RepID=UPI001782CFF3|nr:NERD domain-containing protein/DEAD/DEAH box helicase [Variovorax sp. 38R]QOF76172.1 NERD domain-containing protein [Variovorax sp. 38R]